MVSWQENPENKMIVKYPLKLSLHHVCPIESFFKTSTKPEDASKYIAYWDMGYAICCSNGSESQYSIVIYLAVLNIIQNTSTVQLTPMVEGNHGKLN